MTSETFDRGEAPSAEIIIQFRWAMTLIRDLAATPAVGDRRVRQLLMRLRDRHRATAAAATIESADDELGLVALGWDALADLARASHRLGGTADGLIVHRQRLDARRTARVELFRGHGRPFAAADAAWLAVTHAGCAWVYPDLAESPTLAASVSLALERLSPRDRETLDHLLNGASEKQIAARVGRSPHTIHTRVKRIYRRLGVSSRPELLAYCLGPTPEQGP